MNLTSIEIESSMHRLFAGLACFLKLPAVTWSLRRIRHSGLTAHDALRSAGGHRCLIRVLLWEGALNIKNHNPVRMLPPPAMAFLLKGLFLALDSSTSSATYPTLLSRKPVSCSQQIHPH
jgi:hypothetical protein